MTPRVRGALIVAALAIAAAAAPLGAQVKPISPAERAFGHKLVAFGTCNDCHTPGWRESDGTLPEKQWLTGNTIGFRGPWGTVYPANVRLVFRQIDEEQWLRMVRTRGGQPPMVWHDLRALDATSLRTIYRFVRNLGPAGKPAPTGLRPDREPSGPYYNVVPVNPK